MVLEQIVLEAIGNLADFVRCYESVFLYLLAKKHSALQKTEMKSLRKTVADGEQHLKELDRLTQTAFERNALGTLEDEKYKKLMASYDAEQNVLAKTIEQGKQTLEQSEQQVLDLRLVLKTLRELTNLKELTPTLVNTLIQRIEVHSNEKKHKHNRVKVDIYFTAIGMIDIPIEQEIMAMIKEVEKNPQAFRSAA